MKRFEVSWEEDTKEFVTYKSAFNFYMKIRDNAKWLFVLDNEKGEYLICENCFAK